MKKIFVRSPYFITIEETGQTGSKVELFIWNKGTSEPTTPTYTLSKLIPSPNIVKTTYNIANYCKEFIKPIAPVTVSVPTEENVNTWCYCKVKRYKLVGSTYTLLDTETFVALNGYTNYIDGYNNYTDTDILPLVNTNIKMLRYTNIPYITVFVNGNQYDWTNNSYNFIDVTEDGMWKLPVNNNVCTFGIDGSPVNFTFYSEQLCEPKYTPLVCTFINRYGAWQYLTFFKANTSSIETTSKDFQLLPDSINYNELQGQKRAFNQQGKKKISCNTGWVDEDYFDLIQDLLLSEVVLLNEEPVMVTSKSADYKTHLKDKNINYIIEFEYNFGLINDVI